jgi:hypothetical protein
MVRIDCIGGTEMTGLNSCGFSPRRPDPDEFKRICVEWAAKALENLPPESVYGKWLTGDVTTHGSLICRDPESPTGDRNPSAVVTVVGHPDYGPCRFYSFRDGRAMSAFDFLEKYDPEVNDYYEAKKKVALLSGVPMPRWMLKGTDRPF